MRNNDGRLPVDLLDPVEMEDEYTEQIRQVFDEAEIWLNRKGPLFVRRHLQNPG